MTEDKLHGPIRVAVEALWVCRVAVVSFVFGMFLFSIPQARDVLLEVYPDSKYAIVWGVFWLAVVLAWMLPIYASARYALHAMPVQGGLPIAKRNEVIAQTLPGVLAATPAIILLHGFHQARLRMPGAIKDQKEFANHLGIQSGAALIGILAVIVCLLLVLRQARSAPQLVDNTPERTNVGLVAVTVLSVAAAVIIAVGPLLVPGVLARAQLIPILLGLWIAPLTLLSVQSSFYRVPFIPIFLGLLLLVDLALVHRYDVKVALPETKQRPDFQQAFGNWRKAQNCALGTKEANLCPKVIVVAADGGASRAAFFTGTVLGVLEDLSTPKDPNNRPYRQFSSQTFAISSVSGSSLGAAHFVAARKLHDLKGATMFKGPAEKAKEPHWFKDTWAGNKPWKDTLQILAAGDFLTPPAAHFLFRDLFSLGSPTRADVLEDAWRAHFRRVFNIGEPKYDVFSQPLTALGTDLNERWLPILYLNGTSVERGHRIVASPVTPSMPGIGDAKKSAKSAWNVLYTDSLDLHDMINSRKPSVVSVGDGKEERLESADEVVSKARMMITRDVSLSTAVLSSARFPFVSPHGTITNADEDTIDRIVDGGYFETNGALTAIDIIDSLTRVRRADLQASAKLPGSKCGTIIAEEDKEKCKRIEDSEKSLSSYFILQISNDPEPGRCGAKVEPYHSFDPSATLPMPKTDRYKFFSSFWSIIDGVLSARTARGTHASEYLSFLATDDDEQYFPWRDTSNPGFVHIRICPPPKTTAEPKDIDLSMSWWLSRPVQRYLNAQLCDENNVEGFAKALRVLDTTVVLTPKATEDDDKVLATYREKVTDYLRCGTGEP